MSSRRAATRSTTASGRGRPPMRAPAKAVATWTRYLGAIALLGVGLEHLEQYSVDYYSEIPTIGTLFVLNFASAALIAFGLLAPVQRLRGAPGNGRRRSSASLGSESPPAPWPAYSSAR